VIPGVDQVDLALYLNALTFLVAAFVIWNLPSISGRRAEGPVDSSETFLGSLKQGFSFAGHTRLVRGLIVGITGAMAAAGVIIATGQAFAGLADFNQQQVVEGLPAISLAWGLWNQTSSMTGALEAVDFARFARDGIVAMSSTQALQLLDTAMVIDEPFLLPAHIDTTALRVKFDAGTLPPMFVDLINAPARRQVDDSLAAAKSKSALLQRLDGLPEDEQQAVLLDLVRSHVATVLGNSTPEAIDPDKAFQELGFDSLTAVEMRNRLKAANCEVTDVVDQITSSLSQARSQLEEQWARGEDASTEDLRVALTRYREFFQRLLTV